MRRLTLLASALFVFSGLFAQTYDAQTMAKMRADKETAIAMELQNPTKIQTPQNVSKDDILMHTGTVTTCSGTFYDSGGADGQYASNENFTLTLVPATAGAQMMVTFSEVDIENNWDQLKVYNGSSTSSPLFGIITGTNVPQEPYFGTSSSGALTFHFTSDGSGTRSGWVASVECFVLVPNNLSAGPLVTTAFATAETPKTVGVTVKNMGTADVAASAYTVKLMDADNNVLATSNGVALPSNEAVVIDVTWTPTTVGNVVIKGLIDFPADEDQGNNETAPIAIEIYPAGTYVAQVGTSATLPSLRIPFDFYYKNSASQTIYTPNQLGIGGGIINAIGYKNNFATNLTEGRPVKIWIGETTETNLTAGWIDPATLTLVYDGTLSLPNGVNEISITLDTPYAYLGGNLVVYTNRTYENGYHSSSDKFYGTEFPGSSCTRRLSTDTEFNPLTPTGSSTVIHTLPNTTFFFSTDGLGALSGTVTCEGNPVQGAKVQIVGSPGNTMTDAAGMYSFPYLMADIYSIEVSKFGYGTATETDITVVGDQTTTVDVSLSIVNQYMVSGTVTASDSNLPIEGAVVTFTGYSNYVDTTDATGHYSMSGVYGDGEEYAVEIEAEGYSSYEGNITVNSAHITDGNFIVEEIAYPAIGVTAEINAANAAVVSWLTPGNLVPVEFRYDNGIQTGQLGSSSGTANTVLGSVHRVNAQVTEVSWFTTTEGGPHNSVNIFILSLNASGQPTNTILYSAMNVANTDMQWNTLTLPEAVDAPNGFMLGLSATGFAGLGTTDPDAEYPFIPNTQFFAGDYTTGSFSAVETLGDFSINFMIRASGYDMGKNAYSSFAYLKSSKVNNAFTYIANNPIETGAPVYKLNGLTSKVRVDYSVYRLLQGQEMAEWTVINANTTDTSIVDNTWATAAAGLYQYAVVVNYTNGVVSAPAFSNILPKAMETAYTVNITTNSSDPATGAVVTLTNQDGNADHAYTMTAGATGATFPTVWKGTYDLTITKTGFTAYATNDLVIDNDGLSHTAQLIEIITAPYALEAIQDGANANFSWNNATGFSDDFESYDNFAVQFNPWTLIDVDGVATYGFTGITFPHSGEPMAGIIFNPNATTPPMESSLAHSGDKYVAVFNTTSGSNNDWIISPKTNIPANGQVSFWARGGHADYSAEKFQVFVSTTNTVPASFTSISPVITCPANSDTWVKYTYSLSTYEGQEVYVGLHITSTDQFYFCLDDFEIGIAKEASKSFAGYSVYKDGVEEATGVTATNYVFENLAPGTYTLGVKSVFSSGSSAIETMEYDHDTPVF
ncbi:MAG: carboxypeptidase regulatory-like domain-containing protein, partial [Salinivirgaceae bacterium]|nr:carboxypeptidase regulatory-like domain-containing protein [Salinivirgaceae bacterium]